LGAFTKKKPRCRGRTRTSPRRKNFLGANAAGAGIVVRHIARLFVHFFLLLAGLARLLVRLLALLISFF
jgi:hypothetical protein